MGMQRKEKLHDGHGLTQHQQKDEHLNHSASD
jgi:hypothetical protein